MVVDSLVENMTIVVVNLWLYSIANIIIIKCYYPICVTLAVGSYE